MVRSFTPNPTPSVLTRDTPEESPKDRSRDGRGPARPKKRLEVAGDASPWSLWGSTAPLPRHLDVEPPHSGTVKDHVSPVSHPLFFAAMGYGSPRGGSGAATEGDREYRAHYPGEEGRGGTHEVGASLPSSSPAFEGPAGPAIPQPTAVIKTASRVLNPPGRTTSYLNNDLLPGITANWADQPRKCPQMDAGSALTDV